MGKDKEKEKEKRKKLMRQGKSPFRQSCYSGSKYKASLNMSSPRKAVLSL